MGRSRTKLNEAANFDLRDLRRGDVKRQPEIAILRGTTVGQVNLLGGVEGLLEAMVIGQVEGLERSYFIFAIYFSFGGGDLLSCRLRMMDGIG